MTDSDAPANPDLERIQTAIATGDRPSAPSSVSASLTFGWRALLKLKHAPEQLLDVTVIPVMFLLMLAYLFGGALEDSTSVYLQDLLPGILAMSVIFITTYTGITLNDDIGEGIFDRFRTLPVWQPA